MTRDPFSDDVEAVIQRAFVLADQRRHSLVTSEHVLLALTEDATTAVTLRACGADLARLRRGLIGFIDDELGALVSTGADLEPALSTLVHRVLHGAAEDAVGAGRRATGADVLSRLANERETYAALFLKEAEVTPQRIAHLSSAASPE